MLFRCLPHGRKSLSEVFCRTGREIPARYLVREKRRGAAQEAVEAALSGLEGEDEAARRVLAKYMRGKPPTRETLAKAYRHLLSKGFGHDAAKDALASLREEDEGEEG